MKKAFLFLLLIAVVVPASFSFGKKEDEPPVAVDNNPVIVFNTRTHIGVVEAIDTDQQGHFILTVSRSKQAKLWDGDSGRLIRNFYQPLAPGEEGELYASALSPDASLAAIGGRCGKTWYDEYVLYVFSTKDGKMVGKVEGLPLPASDISFYPDGSKLVVVFREQIHGKNVKKIALINTLDWSVEKVLSLDDADWPINSVTVSSDGSVALASPRRLYLMGPDLKKVRYSDIDRANGIVMSFSPDGNRLLTGLRQTGLPLTIYDNRMKAVGKLSNPDGTHFQFLFWSRNGKNIIGLGENRGKGILRIWNNSGLEIEDNIRLNVSVGWIYDAVSMPDDSIIFGGMDGWKRISSTGELIASQQNPQESLYGEGGLVIHPEEQGVSVPSKGIGFSIQERSEKTILGAPSFPQRTLGRTIQITYDRPMNRDLEEILLNGKRLFEDHHTWSMSRHIFEDEESFLVYDGWKLSHMDDRGKLLWDITVPGIVRKITGSREAGYLTVATEDGLIRWYRLEDGEQLLTLYLNNRDKRWILWTPQGYYDASVGAQDLMGWQVNRGLDREADFFPFESFPDYYRPDIISLVLSTLDVEEAAIAANLKLGNQPAPSIAELMPPVVRILSHEIVVNEKEPEIHLTLSLRAPSKRPVDSLRFLFNKRLISEESLQNSGIVGETSIQRSFTIPAMNGTLAVTASHGDSWGAPDEIQLTIPDMESEETRSGRCFIFTAGTDIHTDSSLNLQHTEETLQLAEEALSKWAEPFFEDLVLEKHNGSNMTKEGILSGLDGLVHDTKNGDLVVIVLSGHGVSDIKAREYLFPRDGNINTVTSTGIPMRTFQSSIGKIKGRVLLLLDIGRQGPWREHNESLFSIDYNGMLNNFIRPEVGATVISSAGHALGEKDSLQFFRGFTEAVTEVEDRDGFFSMDFGTRLKKHFPNTIFLSK